MQCTKEIHMRDGAKQCIYCIQLVCRVGFRHCYGFCAEIYSFNKFLISFSGCLTNICCLQF